MISLIFLGMNPHSLNKKKRKKP
uniref:Uncharacterized protein n=1 Tax=Rhizophora mucronata TaxID=61149 RepID=A0A2P2NGA7_RHIMU